MNSAGDVIPTLHPVDQVQRDDVGEEGTDDPRDPEFVPRVRCVQRVETALHAAVREPRAELQWLGFEIPWQAGTFPTPVVAGKCSPHQHVLCKTLWISGICSTNGSFSTF